MTEATGRAEGRTKRIVAGIGKHRRVLRAALFALLPLLCCMAACALNGRGVGDVYLPASEWNDELFYFKQVEGILSHGYPRGYFGFNESHALKLSFAAWSPVLVFPWILWGLLFGWGLLSPVCCNIFLMTLAVFLFVYLVEPDGKQLLMLGVLFALFTPLTRFMLSGMPEVICFSMVVILLSLFMNYLRSKSGVRDGSGGDGKSRGRAAWKLAAMFATASVMTLMRPYLALFFVMPAYCLIKKKKWLGVAVLAAVLAATGAVYAIIKHYLGAEYFAPLFDVTWVRTFLDEGVFSGVKYVCYRLWDVGKTFTAMLIEGFRSGLPAGAQFGGFILLTGILIVQSAADVYRKKKERLALHLSLAFCFLGMLAALLLMYKPKEGGRHLMTFIVAGIFALSVMETKFYRKAIVTAGVFAYLYSVMALDAYEYRIPYRDGETRQVLERWEDTLDGRLALNMEDTPNFDNVVIWTFGDERGGGTVTTKWQELYALPEGFGISCCYREYVEENFDKLKSRYLAVPTDGSLDERCRAEGFEEIGRSGEVVIYALR